VMDKTGTLTKGEPEVTDVVVDDMDEDELLALVAAVERESEHPLAGAIVQYAADRGVTRLELTGFRNVPGHGATAEVRGHRVVVGNRKLMVAEGVEVGSLMTRRDELAASGRTAVLVAVDGRGAGVIALADAVRETSAEAVAALHALGIEVVMLSGDNQATDERIASQLGIDTVIAEVLPGDKVLMRSDPLDVPVALRIGRGTLRKMRQNLGWAVGYNVIALPIAAGVFEPSLGLVLRPEVAALSMSGSSIIVAANALMLKRLQLPTPPQGDSRSGATRPTADAGRSQR